MATISQIIINVSVHKDRNIELFENEEQFILYTNVPATGDAVDWLNLPQIWASPYNKDSTNIYNWFNSEYKSLGGAYPCLNEGFIWLNIERIYKFRNFLYESHFTSTPTSDLFISKSEFVIGQALIEVCMNHLYKYPNDYLFYSASF